MTAQEPTSDRIHLMVEFVARSMGLADALESQQQRREEVQPNPFAMPLDEAVELISLAGPEIAYRASQQVEQLPFLLPMLSRVAEDLCSIEAVVFELETEGES